MIMSKTWLSAGSKQIRVIFICALTAGPSLGIGLTPSRIGARTVGTTGWPVVSKNLFIEGSRLIVMRLSRRTCYRVSLPGLTDM